MRLFYKLTEPYSDNFDCIYTWTNQLREHWSQNTSIGNGHKATINYQDIHAALHHSISDKPVILGIKDHFTPWQHNPWYDTKPDTVYYFEHLFKKFSNTKFLILTSVEGLERYITSPNVIGIIPWGGDITNQRMQYSTLNPVFNKSWESSYNFISLNRNRRNPRMVFLALLHQANITNFKTRGLISCGFHDYIQDTQPLDILDELDWRLLPTMSSKIIQGLIKCKWIPPNIKEKQDIYTGIKPNDNVQNFKNKLEKYYKNVCIEFVNETSMTEKCFLITEKTMNSIYGCNFPIFISSPGIVKFLKNIGMDVFDDIIDQSYDTIVNPADRIYAAINLNKHLLGDKPHAIRHIWNHNIDRFKNNIEFAKTTLFEYYENRATTMFNDYITRL